MVAKISQISVNPTITLNLLLETLTYVDVTDDYADFLMPHIARLEDADLNGGAVVMEITDAQRMEIVINQTAKIATAELMMLRMPVIFKGSQQDFHRMQFESPAEYAALTNNAGKERAAKIKRYLTIVDRYNSTAREEWGS